MARHDADDLIVGLRALRERIVTESALIAAFTVWEADRARSLGEILVARGSLDAPTLDRLNRPADREPDAPASATVSYTMTASVGYGGGAEATQAKGVVEPTSPGPRYRVIGLHARGGLGEVYSAQDVELDRRVALKELQPRFAHDEMSQLRFLQEAEITGRLEHPGIVPVYGLGRHADGRPFYAMRFVEGETFRAAIDRFHRGESKTIPPEDRELAFRRLLRGVVEACFAVGYAHSRGVVHRDLKPENIMLGAFGETLVVDWGIAKSLAADRGDQSPETVEALRVKDSPFMTRPGSAIGTPAFMSPEQAAGANDRTGPASDVYGLGATLYYLLAGQPPFTGESAVEVLGRVQRGVFPSPRKVRRSVDAALESICLKAMALRPEDRYATILELADELEKWLADVRYRAEQRSAMEQVRDSRSRLALERASSAFGRRKIGEGMVWLSRAMEHGAAPLERAVRTSLTAWHNRSRMLERTLPQPGKVRSLWFSPDGKRLAAADREGVVVLWDVASGTHLGDPLNHPAPVSALLFSADGRWIVTGCRDGSLRRWDGLTGKPVGPAADLGAAVLVLCPCGEGFLAVSQTATTLFRQGNEPETAPAPAGRLFSAVAFSTEGASMAAVDDSGDVWLFNPSTRGWSIGPRPHARGASGLTFHPRDGRLLILGLDGVARLRGRDDSAADAAEFAGFDEAAWSGISPTGETVATISAKGDVQLWDAASGTAVGEPLPHRSRLGEVSFHPEGALVATGCHDGSARLWDAATGLPVGPALEPGGAVEVLAFSPDGRRLAAGCADGRLRFWKTPAPLPGDVERVCCWVRVDANLDIDAADALRPLDALAGWELRRRLHELGGPPLK